MVPTVALKVLARDLKTGGCASIGALLQSRVQAYAHLYGERWAMAIDVTPGDQPVIERLTAAIQPCSAIELQLGQLEDAAMAEFDEQSLPNTRPALAAAHVAGLILIQHGVEEPMRAALQTDLAMLLMKRFRLKC